MQPVVLTIPGRFWDSQVYSGRLYLFDLEGAIVTLDWDHLIQAFPVQRSLRLPITCAFLRSDFLYGSELRLLFRDPDVRRLVQDKFIELSQHILTPKESAIQLVTLGHQDNLFMFPHSDTEIFDSRMYACGPSGIMRATCNKRTKLPVSTRPERFFDCPTTAIAASGGRMAAAAGHDGLFELSVDKVFNGFQLSPHREPRPLVARHCHDCSWVYYSIYGCSTISHGFLAEYSRFIDTKYDKTATPVFEAVRDSMEIFEAEGFSWGVQDKICLASNGTIKIAQYSPWKENRPDRLKRIGEATSIPNQGQVVSASAAPFGLVVEYMDSLVVYPSIGNPVILPGEPTSWRVFPRSKHYENQLHVIRDDAIYIYSFNHDYLVDQDSKILGTRIMRSLTKRDRGLLGLISEDNAG